MKKLDLAKLTADPLCQAQFEADGDTSVVSGYIRSINKDTISLANTQTKNSYVVYERSSVVAAFEDEKRKDKVTLLIYSNANVKIVITRKMNTFKNSKKCKCPGNGVQEARPYSSIDEALGKFMKEMAELKAQATGSSSDLACGEKRADCFRNGGSEEDCNMNFDMCNMDNFFNN